MVGDSNEQLIVDALHPFTNLSGTPELSEIRGTPMDHLVTSSPNQAKSVLIEVKKVSKMERKVQRRQRRK